MKLLRQVVSFAEYAARAAVNRLGQLCPAQSTVVVGIEFIKLGGCQSTKHGLGFGQG